MAQGKARPLVAWAGALGTFTLVTAAMTYPVITHLGTLVIGRPFDDVFESIWYLAWYKRALFDLHVSPLFQPNIFYPVGWDLRLANVPPFYPLALAPLTRLLGAVTTYNLALLGSCVVAAAGLCAVVRRLSGSWAAGVLAGIAFAFYPNRAVYLSGFLNFALGSMWLPWIVYGMVRAAQPGPRRRLWLGFAGLAYGLGIAGAWQMALLALPLWLVFGVVVLRRSGGERGGRRAWLWPGTAGVTAALLVAGPLIAGAWSARAALGANVAFSLDNVAGTGVSVERLIVPSALNPLTSDLARKTFPLTRGEDDVVYFGIVPLALAAVAVLARRNGRKPARTGASTRGIFQIKSGSGRGGPCAHPQLRVDRISGGRPQGPPLPRPKNETHPSTLDKSPTAVQPPGFGRHGFKPWLAPRFETQIGPEGTRLRMDRRRAPICIRRAGLREPDANGRSCIPAGGAAIKPLLVLGLIALVLMPGPILYFWGRPVALHLLQPGQASWLPTVLAPGDGTLRVPLPALLLYLLPPFQLLHHGGRWGLLVALAVDCLAGIGLAWLLARVRNGLQRAVLAALCLALLLAEFNLQPLQNTTPVASMQRPVDAWLARQGSTGPVIEYPLNYANKAQTLYYTLSHGRPIVNGYSQVLPAGYADLAAALNAWPEPAALATLQRIGVQYVLVDAMMSEDFEHERLPGLLANPRLRVVGKFPTNLGPVRDVYVFEVLGS